MAGAFLGKDHGIMHPLEEMLGYRFQDPALLENALTHSSFANEHRPESMESNERLEFLGDSVLGEVTADYLFRTHPDKPEGDLTRMRAALVCEEALSAVAEGWDLGAYLKLGRGEEANGGRSRPSIQADAVEAILAAVYLDGGIAEARRVIRTFILSREPETGSGQDCKTALQELVQREAGHTLAYQLLHSEGPDHMKRFVMGVTLDGEQIGQGEGRSKKEAEQMAAREALDKLKRK